MKVIAAIILGYGVLILFGGPFLIGKERKPLTAGGYVCNLILSAPVILLAFRVLGWL